MFGAASRCSEEKRVQISEPEAVLTHVGPPQNFLTRPWPAVWPLELRLDGRSAPGREPACSEFPRSLLLCRRCSCANFHQSPLGERIPEELDNAVAHHAIEFGHHRRYTTDIRGAYRRRFLCGPAIHGQVRQAVGIPVLFAKHVLDLEVVKQ